MDGFQNCVKGAWDKPVPPTKNPFATLHIKLSRTAKALKMWSRNIVSHAKLVVAIYREVVDRLERVQEVRQLSLSERNSIKALNARLLGLAAIEKRRTRQKSRITWLMKGDANTIFFISWLMPEERRIIFIPSNQVRVWL
jgi:hypothetical protein